MLHAIEAHLPKTLLIAAAGALAALTAFATLRHHHHHHCTSQLALHRLVLHATDLPNQLYLSAWMGGDNVMIEIDREHLTALKFQTRAAVNDGCRWLGTETLIPAGDHYVYTYDETLLSCEPGSIPDTKTPRIGTVTIDR